MATGPRPADCHGRRDGMRGDRHGGDSGIYTQGGASLALPAR